MGERERQRESKIEGEIEKKRKRDREKEKKIKRRERERNTLTLQVLGRKRERRERERKRGRHINMITSQVLWSGFHSIYIGWLLRLRYACVEEGFEFVLFKYFFHIKFEIYLKKGLKRAQRIPSYHLI